MHAAIDVKRRAGDIARAWRGDKRDRRSHLLGVPQPAQRHMLDQVLLLLVVRERVMSVCYEIRVQCN